jgi:hypothetical protein
MVLDELLPAAWHRTDPYANYRIEADDGGLKSRRRPMRGLKQERNARVIIMGHAFVWNIRRSHYELAVEEPASRRLAVAFAEPALVLWDRIRERRAPARLAITQVTDPSEVHSMGWVSGPESALPWRAR